MIRVGGAIGIDKIKSAQDDHLIILRCLYFKKKFC